jgi:Predicted NADH:ubiquinone oxidoreductase, subunit RnfG
MKNIISVTLKLLVITIVCAIALGAVNYITAGPIAEQAALAAQQARQSAFPGAASFEALYDPGAGETQDVTLTSLLGTEEIREDYGIIRTVYTALDADGNPAGIVADAVTRGYGSGLNLTIGIASDGTIQGVLVGDNTETAGLGARAGEDWFQSQYIGKRGPLAVAKANPGDDEVQAITGATITTRGVTNAVNTVSEFYAALNGGAK